mmetsp:Transcript_8801/g.15726  ORF Transcript_8801/g.15726 Transcript_8801/m.15726 type:complete len:85 (-) Transcript_8801:75-329(-)
MYLKVVVGFGSDCKGVGELQEWVLPAYFDTSQKKVGKGMIKGRIAALKLSTLTPVRHHTSAPPKRPKPAQKQNGGAANTKWQSC